MKTNMIRSTLQYILCLLLFTIPLAWWTRLNANYYSTKLTLLYLAGALAWLAIPGQLKVPKFPRPMLYSLVVIVTYQLLHHTYRLQLDDFLYVFKFLSFSALVLWFYSQNLNLEKLYKNVTYALFLSAVTILSFSGYEFYNTRIIDNSTDISVLLSTFGNVNMFAEFLVLTVPLLFHWTRYKDKIPNWLKLLTFGLWIFFILYCRSRSAWVGLFFWLLVQFRYKISRAEIISMALAFVLYFASMYAPSKENNLTAIKENNTAGRLALYEASFEMIKDNPWGIPAGRFMGEIEPYQMNTSFKPSEYSYYDQPHSEFLKWGAQFGWVFLAAAFVFFISVIYVLGRWFWAQKNPLYVETFAVLIPQVLFQFPFENPASLLYLSLVYALFFQEFATVKEVKIHFMFKPLAVALFFAGVYSSMGFLNSVYQESTQPRTEKIVTACEYYPINIKACHAKLTYYIDTKQFEKFVTEFKTDFVKEPFFVDYLRLLPTYYSIKQNNKKTCESLFLYSTIFPAQTAFDKKYYENCKGFANLFYFENPQQFKTQYLTWLDNLN